MPAVIVRVTTGCGGGMNGLPSEGQVPIGQEMPPSSRTIWAYETYSEESEAYSRGE